MAQSGPSCLESIFGVRLGWIWGVRRRVLHPKAIIHQGFWARNGTDPDERPSITILIHQMNQPLVLSSDKIRHAADARG